MDRKNICAFTLRITPELDDQITGAAYDRKMSKAEWIRMAIRQTLRDRTETHE